MADAVALLEEIRRLMELKGENPFKVRAFERAAQSLPEPDDLAKRGKAGTLTELPGIGKGIAEVLTEFLEHGKSTVLEELRTSLPPGLLELTQVPGLGPKKAKVLIEELEIHSLGELEYACRENRLLKLTGFGPKVQQKILDGVQFLHMNRGKQRLPDAFAAAEKVLPILLKAVNDDRHPAAQGLKVTETGALRRRMETVSSLEFLVEIPPGQSNAAHIRSQAEKALAKFKSGHEQMLHLKLYYATAARFGYELARTTATEEHWRALGAPEPFDAASEDQFYERLELPWIPPEARETGEEVALARAGKLKQLLPWNGIRGVFHNHTTRSDGTATLEEMVCEAQKLGYSYIGISDHSQSAFYAQGLKPDILLDQEKEIRLVQEKYPDIRVFWGIESDILADGSLDYDASVLKKFDFVIASVHSRFKMDKEAMTERIVQAIRNPCTRFVGHVTGRLLLGRKGYEIDMEKIIEEAAKNDVAIEINAHPARLDIDWRWGSELRRNRASVSVNPDAHETAGLQDTKYGIAMARKALLPSELVINSGSVAEVEKWLKRR